MSEPLPTRRIWQWPIRVRFARPTKRVYVRVPDTPSGACGCCYAVGGQEHHDECINRRINLAESRA